MITRPSANAAAKKIPMTVSSLTRRRCENSAMSTATVMPATAPPRRIETCSANAIASPGNPAWATASPMNAMPRSTTWVPTTPHTAALSTEMMSAFGRKASSGLVRSLRKSATDSMCC